MDRCTGHCCKDIPLHKSPEQLEQALEDGSIEDIETIQSMLIPLRQVGDWWIYDCRHFDKENKLCRIYDRRPKMCQRYGESIPCSTVGCTWSGARLDLVEKR